MPKESPTTSSLWAGPTPHAWPGRGALVSSPSGPPVPRCPRDRAGRATGAGPSPARDQGSGAAAAGRERGHWHDLPPGAVAFGDIGGAPRAATAGGTSHGSAWELGTQWHLVPSLRPTGIQRGTPRTKRGTPAAPGGGGGGEGDAAGGVRGALAVMEQQPGRCGTPAPASPGCGTLVSAGILGWEREEGAAEGTPAPRLAPGSRVSPATSPAWCRSQHPAPGALPPHGHGDLGHAVPMSPAPSPCPRRDGSRKPRSCGQPRGPAVAPRVPTLPHRPGVSLPRPGCASTTLLARCHLPGATKPPRGRSTWHTSPGPPHPPTTPFCSKPPREAPTAPAQHHSGPAAASSSPQHNFFLGNLTFKAVVLVRPPAEAVPPASAVPSLPPSLGFWFQCKVL